MTAPFSYTDPDGDRIEVVPSAVGGANLFISDDTSGDRACVTIKPGALPDLVAAMYRAAGLTVPVLINPDEVADDWVHVTGTAGAA